MTTTVRRLASIGAPAALALALSTAASAEVAVQAGASGPQAVTGLTDPADPGCAYLAYRGSVAQRKFAKDGMTIDGFILEQADGTRMSINVYLPDDLARAPRMTAMQALQALLKEGSPVAGRAQACGSGPIIMLDSVARTTK